MWVMLWQTAQARNYLVIVADDLGADKISSYAGDFPGYATDPDVEHLPSTPVIDQLAASGARFTNAWANPSCSPTRAGLQTGLHAANHGIGSALMDADPGLDPLMDGLLGQIFHSNGYATGYFGKWHVGTGTAGPPTISPLPAPPHPVELGYDRFHGTVTGELTPDYFDWPLVDWANNAGTYDRTPGVHALSDTTQAAIDWIEDVSTQGDWFAIVAYHAPHAPAAGGWNVADLDPSCPVTAACLLTNPISCQDSGTNGDELDRAVYSELVECLDTKVGDLLHAVAQAGELEDTLVVFLGDNGTPDDVLEGAFTSVAGGKSTPYESGVRVPLVVTDGAAMVTGGIPTVTAVTITTPVLALDLHATLLDHANLVAPTATDAKTFRPCFDDGICGWGPRFRYTEKFDDFNSDPFVAVRWGPNDKMHATLTGGCFQTSFYDLSVTPFEDAEPVTPWPEARKDRLENHLIDMAPSWAGGATPCP